MPLVIQSSRHEMVDSFEIRIGSETISAHFGRRVPITHAVKLAREWLNGIDKPSDAPTP